MLARSHPRRELGRAQALPLDLRDEPDRRQFIKHVGCIAAAGTAPFGIAAWSTASVGVERTAALDSLAVLVDLDACVGCRLCERACKESNNIPTGERASYDDQSVFQQHRRPTPDSLTVVNAFKYAQRVDKVVAAPHRIYAKTNCMHCNQPACVSACIVGALRKQPTGAVTYDAWKCIGCPRSRQNFSVRIAVRGVCLPSSSRRRY